VHLTLCKEIYASEKIDNSFTQLTTTKSQSKALTGKWTLFSSNFVSTFQFHFRIMPSKDIQNVILHYSFWDFNLNITYKHKSGIMKLDISHITSENIGVDKGHGVIFCIQHACVVWLFFDSMPPYPTSNCNFSISN
jgi:hypothetical protein